MVPLEIETDPAILEKLFCYDTFKEDYKVLNTEVRKLGYNIPPLVNAYMSLSPTMRMFGTAINDGFGDVEETGILIAVDEILEENVYVILNRILRSTLRLFSLLLELIRYCQKLIILNAK